MLLNHARQKRTFISSSHLLLSFGYFRALTNGVQVELKYVVEKFKFHLGKKKVVVLD
jgi:hypothetical protein